MKSTCSPLGLACGKAALVSIFLPLSSDSVFLSFFVKSPSKPAVDGDEEGQEEGGREGRGGREREGGRENKGRERGRVLMISIKE